VSVISSRFACNPVWHSPGVRLSTDILVTYILQYVAVAIAAYRVPDGAL
jgi:hypothetical protein